MTDGEREALLKRLAEPPSDSEQTRADNAERVVKAAIKASDALNKWDIRVFVQGSYRNNTNVRLDSDVDICACLMDTVSTDYTFAKNLSDELLGHTRPATYPYATFKNDLGGALVSAFGKGNVKRGDKTFNVKENTYRVTADAVARIENRRYREDRTWASGTSLYPDSGGHIENWPQQQYENGVRKNAETNYRFKRLVRIMKNLRNIMVEEGNVAANLIPSFLNECLVWNVPNPLMGGTLSDDIRAALVHLWQHTETDEKCKEWGEENELKYLFRPSQPWTRAQARDWVRAAWNRLEYK